MEKDILSNFTKLPNGSYYKSISGKYIINIHFLENKWNLKATLYTKFGIFRIKNSQSDIEWLKNLKIEDLHIVENSLETLWNNLN